MTSHRERVGNRDDGSAAIPDRSRCSPSTSSQEDEGATRTNPSRPSSSSSSSFLWKAHLFVNAFFNVPMWSMLSCLGIYTTACVWAVTRTRHNGRSSWCKYPLLLYAPFILFLDQRPAGRMQLLSYQWIDRLRHLPFFRWVAEYFPVYLHKTCELPATRRNKNNKEEEQQERYIFLYHPHGIIGMGANTALNTNGCNFDTVFPGIKRFGVTLNASFLCPIFREYALLLGFINADKATLKRKLQTEKSSIVLVPGGAVEALHAVPGCFKLIGRRQGFIRLALETGARPVPCLGFGENWAFSTVSFLPGTVGYKIQRAVCKLLSFSTPILSSPFPVRHPIHVVVGEPVVFENDDEDNNKNGPSVDECQQQYMKAVEKLYYEHRDKYGYANVPLEWI